MSAPVVESVREAQRTTVEVESVDYASELVDVRRLSDGCEYRIRLREFVPDDRQRLARGARVEHVWLCAKFADGHTLSGQVARVLEVPDPAPTWPVQGDLEWHRTRWRSRPSGRAPCRCSDADARRAYAHFRHLHGGQSFEHIMERGGYGHHEMDEGAPGWTPIRSEP